MVARELLGEEFHDFVAKLQKYRIKRNDCVYHPTDLITKSETEAIFKTAHEFWQKVRIYIKSKNQQLELFDDF
ncbi:MAG: hypothetical protein KJ811_02415 [Candidatus Margulisbacteria bacterium]|nr:hypothetical protein [Candidatus Margulisiibacteriota bacterium]